MEWTKLILSSGAVAGVLAIVLAVLQRGWRRKDSREDILDALVAAQKIMMVEQVRWLGQSYIQAGCLTLEDKETLYAMHEAYKALGGNGSLDTVMGEIAKLRVIPNEGGE